MRAAVGLPSFLVPGIVVSSLLVVVAGQTQSHHGELVLDLLQGCLLYTSFDIKADVLVSMALIASVCIGEYFAAGEVALIMQLGALLEELTVARARAGIEKLVHLTPQTARLLVVSYTHLCRPGSGISCGKRRRCRL